MHNIDLDLSLEEITKIEGAATLDLKIRNGVVKQCKFSISEFKRFYTQAIRGKSISAVPQLVARICGTCSNAHLLCSLKSLEKAIGYTPNPQTKLLRKLLNYGLMIRDHALHLYVFVLPDLYNRASILDFDENNPEEHELLDSCFAVKSVGNQLGVTVGGRSVHAPNLMLGGFTKIPSQPELASLIPKLEEIRPQVLKLIDIFHKNQFELIQDTEFVAQINDDFNFLEGKILTKQGDHIPEEKFSEHLEKSLIPYSQASGYRFDGKIHLVGALARVNLNQKAIHSRTRADAKEALAEFPSINIYHNNLAQAIEILHCIDSSIDLIKKYEAKSELLPKIELKDGIGYAVTEAPRGLLYHEMHVVNGKIKTGQIVVPTGQNQIGIERSIFDYVSEHVNKPKKELTHEIEKIIRAYDPCMSCATHFLKVNWK